MIVGCGKGYVVYTDNGVKKVAATEVDNSNWSPIVGSDVTVSYPLQCPYSAIGWNEKLDREQCNIEHRHLTGANKGQTELVKYVHNSETVVKKALSGLWFMLAFIPNLFGGGNDVTNNNSANAAGVGQTNVYNHPHFIGKP